MENKPLTHEQKELIKRIEQGKKVKNNTVTKEDYLKQTDRNYKDGDRN
ncbi:MAG: hypothetical protein ACI35W_00750 [Anaeroplasmataceae bacterium]